MPWVTAPGAPLVLLRACSLPPHLPPCLPPLSTRATRRTAAALAARTLSSTADRPRPLREVTAGRGGTAAPAPTSPLWRWVGGQHALYHASAREACTDFRLEGRVRSQCLGNQLFCRQNTVSGPRLYRVYVLVFVSIGACLYLLSSFRIYIYIFFLFLSIFIIL